MPRHASFDDHGSSGCLHPIIVIGGKVVPMLEELALGKDASSAEGPDCQPTAE